MLESSAPLPSILPEVSDEDWTAFVRSMLCGRLGEVSESNALGLFGLMPRRLYDLGMVESLARTKSPTGKTIWVAAFVPPLTCDTFLRSPSLQYLAFCKSILDYYNKLKSGEIDFLEEASLSGNLALLQRCGPNGIKTWISSERFPATIATFQRADGVF